MQARVQMTYLDAMSELLDSLGRPTCQTYPVLHKQISMTKMSLLGPVMSRKTALISSFELGLADAVYQTCE